MRFHVSILGSQLLWSKRVSLLQFQAPVGPGFYCGFHYGILGENKENFKNEKWKIFTIL